MWGNRYVPRSPENVVEEVKLYVRKYAIVGFDIIDLTFSTNRRWIERFCRLLLEEDLKLEWYVPSTRSEVIDDDIAGLLKRSGCAYVYLTPDSGSPRQIEEMSKKVDLVKVKGVAGALLRHGIGVRVNIVFAFPNERHGDVWRSIRYGMELAWLGVQSVIFLRFTPYPGSEYFDLCRQRGRIPPYGPEFDHFLISDVTGELSEVRSYTPHVSDKAVKRYLVLGTLLTQAAFVSAHPLEGSKVARRVLTDRPDSPLEHAFAAMFRGLRSRLAGRAPRSGQAST
jgi:hypothetical protein